MKTHHCPRNPDLPDPDDPWVEGGVAGCLFHGTDGRKQLGFKMGKADRRALDRAAGVVGEDRGGYIHAD